ncbi:hypothetical protein Lal_00028596, partial [Lupinus albus]
SILTKKDARRVMINMPWIFFTKLFYKARYEIVKSFQGNKKKVESYFNIIDGRWDSQLCKNLHDPELDFGIQVGILQRSTSQINGGNRNDNENRTNGYPSEPNLNLIGKTRCDWVRVWALPEFNFRVRVGAFSSVWITRNPTGLRMISLFSTSLNSGSGFRFQVRGWITTNSTLTRLVAIHMWESYKLATRILSPTCSACGCE